MKERLRVEEDVRRLPVAEWLQLDCRHPALRPELLQVPVYRSRDASRPFCFLLEDGAGLAAAAFCMLVAPDQVGSAGALLYGRAAQALQRLGVGRRPVIQCRAPLTGHSSVAIRPAPDAEQCRLRELLLDSMDTHAADRNLDIAFIGVAHDDRPLRASLRARGYLETKVHPTATMQVNWKDFDGYRDSLRRRSQNSAKTARAERNRNRRNGVTIRQVPAGPAETASLYQVMSDHHRLKNGWDPPFDAAYLVSLAQRLGDDFLIFEAQRAGRRVAMMGGIRWRSVAWLPWYGMDPRDRPNDFTYANLVFYHLADAASTLGLRTLLYGNLALEAKRRRGCEIHASHLYYRPRRQALCWLLRPWFSLHRQIYWRKLQ